MFQRIPARIPNDMMFFNFKFDGLATNKNSKQTHFILSGDAFLCETHDVWNTCWRCFKIAATMLVMVPNPLTLGCKWGWEPVYDYLCLFLKKKKLFKNCFTLPWLIYLLVSIFVNIFLIYFCKISSHYRQRTALNAAGEQNWGFTVAMWSVLICFVSLSLRDLGRNENKLQNVNTNVGQEWIEIREIFCVGSLYEHLWCTHWFGSKHRTT